MNRWIAVLWVALAAIACDETQDEGNDTSTADTASPADTGGVDTAEPDTGSSCVITAAPDLTLAQGDGLQTTGGGFVAGEGAAVCFATTGDFLLEQITIEPVASVSLEAQTFAEAGGTMGAPTTATSLGTFTSSPQGIIELSQSAVVLSGSFCVGLIFQEDAQLGVRNGTVGQDNWLYIPEPGWISPSTAGVTGPWAIGLMGRSCP